MGASIAGTFPETEHTESLSDFERRIYARGYANGYLDGQTGDGIADGVVLIEDGDTQ